jgi:hypothetical protein
MLDTYLKATPGVSTEEIIEAAREHLAGLGKWDIDNSAITIIRNQMNSDGDANTNEDSFMLEMYVKASLKERVMLDEFLTRICGYSFRTVLHAMTTGKDIVDASMEVGYSEAERIEQLRCFAEVRSEAEASAPTNSNS